jgi:hypothetical protein
MKVQMFYLNIEIRRTVVGVETLLAKNHTLKLHWQLYQTQLHIQIENLIK